MPTSALIADYRPDRVFAWRDSPHGDGKLDCAQALAEILVISAQLVPERSYLNLCEDRTLFTLTFAAVCLAGGTNLLPSSHAAGALQGVRKSCTDAGEINDEQVQAWLRDSNLGACPETSPHIPLAHCAAIVFTSGSTGAPTAHRKYWRDLQVATQLLRQRFFPETQSSNVVATVPAQHMFGLETSVLPVLLAGFAAHRARPSMPWEIADALAAMPAPRVLITTPLHMRACIRAGTPMPEIHRCISATAPLSVELAQTAEALWQTEVHEIYGCTEAGSLASRRTVQGVVWTLYDSMQLKPTTPPEITGAQLPEPVPINDELEILPDGQFRLLGRSQDMLKVAGKRLSLGELTQRLLDIDGVTDAAVFLPDTDARLPRPAALVVAPGLQTREIAARLAQVLDPVFVPRPLVIVESLPRNAVGKLPRAELEALLKRQSSHE